MRVGCEDQGIALTGPELASDMALRLGPHLVHHLIPLAVGEAGGVIPCLDLSFEAGVRPEVMAVRREVQPLGIRRQAAAEQRLETQRAVLSDHNSGNTRFSSVARR